MIVRAFKFFSKQKEKIGCLCELPLQRKHLKREFGYAFSDKKYPGVPDLELNTITLDPFFHRRYFSLFPYKFGISKCLYWDFVSENSLT
jgi:hypothetical protein